MRKHTSMLYILYRLVRLQMHRLTHLKKEMRRLRWLFLTEAVTSFVTSLLFWLLWQSNALNANESAGAVGGLCTLMAIISICIRWPRVSLSFTLLSFVIWWMLLPAVSTPDEMELGSAYGVVVIANLVTLGASSLHPSIATTKEQPGVPDNLGALLIGYGVGFSLGAVFLFVPFLFN